MVKNYNNIYKMNNPLSPQITEDKIDQGIYPWKYGSLFGTDKKVWSGETVNGIPIL